MTLPLPLAPLAAYQQFVVYRLEPNHERPGKMDKLPCDWRTGALPPRGHGGSSIWTDHATATANAVRCDRGNGSGVGFSLAATDPYWFLDIDNCVVDGQWSPLAHTLMERLAGAAVEVSQSGRGLHIIGRGVVPDHRCKNIPLGLELYTEQRFIALTGTHATGNVDHDVGDAVALVVAEYFAPQTRASGAVTLDDWTSEPSSEWSGPSDDDELIKRMLASRSVAAALDRGVSLKTLWERDVDKLAQRWPADKPDQQYDASAADGALFSHLAWWTGHNCERIDRIARLSGLYRDKYERDDYMVRSIMRAAGQVSGCYVDPKLKAASLAPPVETRSTRYAGLTSDQLGDKANHLTIEMWIEQQGPRIWYDEFRDVVMADDQPLTDHIERELWFDCRAQSSLKMAKEMFADVLRGLAWRNREHPLRDWLAERQASWDGTRRLDTWMTTYLGVAPSPYSQAVGAIFLTAAVRRIRQPGAKFDEMIVLEGPQGIEKSTAVATLCDDPEWFCDSMHLRMDSKELLEMTRGKWIVEAPELSRMRDSEVEHVKAMLSRRTDRARMAYDRHVTDRGRQWVGFATTNADKYLHDPTGNRRIWPATVTSVDIAGLARDRQQLWAEAALREASGASIRLPRELWAAAAEEQAERVVTEPLFDELSAMLGDMSGRIRGRDLFAALRVPAHLQGRMARQLGESMRLLGWENKMVSVHGEKIRFYVKGAPEREITALGHKLQYAPTALLAVS